MSTPALALYSLWFQLTWLVLVKCIFKKLALPLPRSPTLCFLNCLSIHFNTRHIIREKNWAAKRCCLITYLNWIHSHTSEYKRFHSFQSKELLVHFFGGWYSYAHFICTSQKFQHSESSEGERTCSKCVNNMLDSFGELFEWRWYVDFKKSQAPTTTTIKKNMWM